MQLKEIIKALIDCFEEKFNLLIVDDYPAMGNAIVDLFGSPLYSKTLAASAAEARQKIALINRWHSWVLDIAMEEEESGLKLLSDYNNFPYIIMLSGMRSMHMASRAMQLGAYKVYDKNPEHLRELHKDVNTLSALSWILQGVGTKYLSQFLLLSEYDITTTDTWAMQACMTVRQLERICTIHSHLTPRFIPSLFYTLQFLLGLEDTSDQYFTAISENISESLEQHTRFVHKHLDTILAKTAL